MNSIVFLFIPSIITRTLVTQCTTNIEGKVCDQWWCIGGWLQRVAGVMEHAVDTRVGGDLLRTRKVYVVVMLNINIFHAFFIALR